MDVIINTDHNITMSESSIDQLESEVQSHLAHFASHLTRVEVHLSDASAGRSTGDDIRCEVEARPEGRQPESATDHANSVDDALSGALRKMVHVLESSFGRLDHRKGGKSMGGVEPR